MPDLGKNRRFQKIRYAASNRFLIVPLDHSVTVGPILGLDNIKRTLHALDKGGASAIIGHYGTLRTAINENVGLGLIHHISSSTVLSPHKDNKVLTASVDFALKLGVDAVSIHINLGVDNDKEMLHNFGSIASQCYDYGIPLLAMLYTPKSEKKGKDRVAEYEKLVRLAFEIGADMVKIAYPGDYAAMQAAIAAAPIPVLIAGGGEGDEESLLQLSEEVVSSGAAGLSVGRRIFQHKDPALLLAKLRKIIDAPVKK